MILRYFSRLTVLGVLLLWLPQIGYSQMFSVDRERPKRQPHKNQIYVGLEPAEFTYFGPQSSSGQARFDMNYPILRVSYESRNTELFIGYGDTFTGADSVDIFNLGGRFMQNVPLHTSKNFRVLIPIQLQADLTTAANDLALNEKFQQSSIMIGAGPGLFWRIAPKLRWTSRLVPHIGYSLSPGGTFGGTLYQLGGHTRFMVDEVFGKIGLSFGYNYTFKRYNIEVERFDYKWRAHTLLIGITF